ncbi:MAG: hypothetical protein DME44_08765 [Verrucomicrobia bacterium]|nr:MAG: hypothetical protein DME44_08765 [Verrucomicrobiota bacterium]
MIATVENKLDAIRGALPSEGLFADKDWLISPEAFPISQKFASELEQLGHRLFVFQRACNQLYQLSFRGKQPQWIAKYLDAGKPAKLVVLSRQKIFRDELPRVIRPDLILTEKSYIIAEIDSVPGGIGLTGWLNRTYSALGQDVIGGEDGMLHGFQMVLHTERPTSNIQHRIGAFWRRRIMSHNQAAMFIDSSNYSICRIFRRSRRS